MFNPTSFFDAFLVIPILNVLIAFYKMLQGIGLPGSLGFSIILLTIATRLVLHPLTVTQLKSSYKLSKLKPELDKIADRFKGDKQRIHQEQLRLYKEAGVNPAAGCLPLLIQMPILVALYNLFNNLLSNGNLPKVIENINNVVYFPFLKISSLDLSLFGINLAYKPSDWQKFGWWLLLVPVITALLQYWQTKMMAPKNASLASGLAASAPARSASTGQAPQKEKTKEDDMAATMQKQMTIMMPLMIGYFAYTFSVGLSLYWNTFTVFAIIQQNYLNKKMETQNEKKDNK